MHKLFVYYLKLSLQIKNVVLKVISIKNLLFGNLKSNNLILIFKKITKIIIEIIIDYHKTIIPSSLARKYVKFFFLFFGNNFAILKAYKNW